MGNIIKDESTKTVDEVLRINNTLVLLGLGNNNIRNEGMKTINKLLKINTTFKKLDLDYNIIYHNS